MDRGLIQVETGDTRAARSCKVLPDAEGSSNDPSLTAMSVFLPAWTHAARDFRRTANLECDQSVAGGPRGRHRAVHRGLQTRPQHQSRSLVRACCGTGLKPSRSLAARSCQNQERSSTNE